MNRPSTRLLIELLLGSAAVVFAVLFVLGVGGTVSVKTRTVVRTHTVVKVVAQPGVAVGERSFALNLPKGESVFPDPAQAVKDTPGAHPSSAQTSMSYMVGGTLVQVISARMDSAATSTPNSFWMRSFKMPFTIDKRPYTVQGHPGFLYVNKTQAYLQLVVVVRIEAQQYMIMVGDPLPATEQQELPKLAQLIDNLQLHPSPKPFPKPGFKQFCDGAKYQLAHYNEQGLKLSQAKARVKEVCNPNSTFYTSSQKKPAKGH
jgi:hypothetical protein